MYSFRLWWALVVLVVLTGCQHSKHASRAHEVVDGLGQPLAGSDVKDSGDTFEWQDRGPLDFLKLLRSQHDYSVRGLHRGWLKATDVPELLALLDSKDPCGSVAMEASSYYESGLSTVGQEAAFLIEGFRRGQYPPGLNSTRMELNSEELRTWWREYEKSLDGT